MMSMKNWFKRLLIVIIIFMKLVLIGD